MARKFTRRTRSKTFVPYHPENGDVFRLVPGGIEITHPEKVTKVDQCPVRDAITGEQCKLGDRHPCRHMFLLNVGRKRCSGTCGEERCVLSAGHPSVCLFPVDFRGR